MNFLQLVQRLHSESGRQGTTPAAVTGQTGMNARLVNWIITADEDIQRLHESWFFRRDDFSFSTIDGTQNYTPVGVSIDDLSAWWFNPSHDQLSGIRLYSSVSDEVDLVYIPWEDFRANYKYGSHRTTESRPTIFSIKPDMSMDFWAIPDAVYTVNGEYVKKVVTMDSSTDTPVYPSDFHVLPVWRALMFYGVFEGAPEVYAHGKNEYDSMLTKLEFSQLEKLSWGPPLV